MEVKHFVIISTSRKNDCMKHTPPNDTYTCIGSLASSFSLSLSVGLLLGQMCTRGFRSQPTLRPPISPRSLQNEMFHSCIHVFEPQCIRAICLRSRSLLNQQYWSLIMAMAILWNEGTLSNYLSEHSDTMQRDHWVTLEKLAYCSCCCLFVIQHNNVFVYASVSV